jgi:hypothetical protein
LLRPGEGLGLIERLARQDKYNSFGYLAPARQCEAEGQDGDDEDHGGRGGRWDRALRASGVFPRLALANHSCMPSAFRERLRLEAPPARGGLGVGPAADAGWRPCRRMALRALHALPPVRDSVHPYIRVRVEIMGLQKCRIVGKYQSVLMMINPVIFTRTRIIRLTAQRAPNLGAFCQPLRAMIWSWRQGTEVTHSYVPLGWSLHERHQRCREQYGFICTCARCKFETEMEDSSAEHQETDVGSHEEKRRRVTSDGPSDDSADVQPGVEAAEHFEPGYIDMWLLKHICDQCGGTMAPIECGPDGGGTVVDQPSAAVAPASTTHADGASANVDGTTARERTTTRGSDSRSSSSGHASAPPSLGLQQPAVVACCNVCWQQRHEGDFEAMVMEALCGPGSPNDVEDTTPTPSSPPS